AQFATQPAHLHRAVAAGEGAERGKGDAGRRPGAPGAGDTRHRRRDDAQPRSLTRISHTVTCCVAGAMLGARATAMRASSSPQRRGSAPTGCNPKGRRSFAPGGRRRAAYDARIAARPGSYPGAKDRRRSAWPCEKSGLAHRPVRMLDRDAPARFLDQDRKARAQAFGHAGALGAGMLFDLARPQLKVRRMTVELRGHPLRDDTVGEASRLFRRCPFPARFFQQDDNRIAPAAAYATACVHIERPPLGKPLVFDGGILDILLAAVNYYPVSNRGNLPSSGDTQSRG